MNTQLENKTELPTICSKRFVKNLINQGNGNNSAHLNLAKEYIHKVASCLNFQISNRDAGVGGGGGGYCLPIFCRSVNPIRTEGEGGGQILPAILLLAPI